MSAPTLTLYPPVISTYMPAFIIQQQNTDSCRVYFSLSKYNTIEDIANVQVTIKSQYTNDNMLSNTKILYYYHFRRYRRRIWLWYLL